MQVLCEVPFIDVLPTMQGEMLSAGCPEHYGAGLDGAAAINAKDVCLDLVLSTLPDCVLLGAADSDCMPEPAMGHEAAVGHKEVTGMVVMMTGSQSWHFLTHQKL